LILLPLLPHHRTAKLPASLLIHHFWAIAVKIVHHLANLSATEIATTMVIVMRSQSKTDQSSEHE
jgi:hypothetical protein